MFSIVIFLPCVLMYQKASNFTSGGVQNRETKNRRLGTIVTSFLQASRKTDFSYIFLFSYKQRNIASFLSELISSQYENDWEICFSRSLKSWIDVTIIPSLLFLVSRLCKGKRSLRGASIHGLTRGITPIQESLEFTDTSGSTLREQTLNSTNGILSLTITLRVSGTRSNMLKVPLVSLQI